MYPCEFKCKYDETKYNSNKWGNNNKCQCQCKKHHLRDKVQAQKIVWNPAKCNCENRKYLASIVGKIIYDKIIDSCNEENKF